MCTVHEKPTMILTSSQPEFNLFRIGLLLGLSYDDHLKFEVVSPNKINLWIELESREIVELTLQAGQRWFYYSRLNQTGAVSAEIEKNHIVNITRL